MNALGMVFDFLGWGYKNPQVPYGNKVSTYKIIIKLLFNIKFEHDTFETAISQSTANFCKMYYLCIAVLCVHIHERNISYLEFPLAVETAAKEIEYILESTVKDEISLNRFLFENFGLDPTLLLTSPDTFYLWLQNETITLAHPNQTLGDFLQNLGTFKFASHIPYLLTGERIEDLTIPISIIDPPVVYYLPPHYTPDKFIVRRVGFNFSAFLLLRNESIMEGRSKSKRMQRAHSQIITKSNVRRKVHSKSTYFDKYFI